MDSTEGAVDPRWMTLPLLACIFVAFSSYDPALHDPPAAYWPKGQVGDVAYPATLFNSAW